MAPTVSSYLYFSSYSPLRLCRHRQFFQFVCLQLRFFNTQSRAAGRTTARVAIHRTRISVHPEYSFLQSFEVMFFLHLLTINEENVAYICFNLWCLRKPTFSICYFHSDENFSQRWQILTLVVNESCYYAIKASLLTIALRRHIIYRNLYTYARRTCVAKAGPAPVV
jgi:hypothetical protein